jgi:hypothetical protein
MAVQEGDTVTVQKGYWQRTRTKAKENEKALTKQTKEGVDLVKQGQLGAGVIEIGGAWAPLITAGVAGGLLYYIAENKTFREMDFVKKHWWVRGFVAGLVALGLWKKGYITWATAVAGAAVGMLLADHKNRDTKEAKESSGPDEAGEAGYWIGDRWVPHHHWDEPRLEMARERLDERLAGPRRAEQLADRVFLGA